MTIPISVFIIAYNEEKIIKKCLEKLFWATEIIIIDSGSSDNTLEICNNYATKVIYNKFENFGNQKQFALNQCANEWVLSIDADEVLSDELIAEFQNFKPTTITGYKIPRTHVFLGKIFKYGSENKKPVLRFFNKKHGCFIENKVHEKIEVQGKIGVFKEEMLHYTVFDMQTAITKQIKYSFLSSEFFHEFNKRASLLKVGIKFPFEFIRLYFIQRNFMNGYEGFIWSMFSAFGSFLKYASLYDLQKNKTK